MTDPTLRDRLVGIIVGAIIGGGPVGDHPALIANALLASEEWEAREAVVKCAQNLDEYMGSDASPTSVWLEFRAALARLAAMRRTT